MSQEETLKQYNIAGIGRQVGFGERPAIICIDFFNGMTDPNFPLGTEVDTQIAATNDLLQVARKQGFPIIHTTVEFADPKEGGPFLKKIPGLAELKPGSHWSAFDDRIKPEPSDYVIVKKYQSGFYGTNLQALLTSLQVDTTIVTGISTSGCVRATVVDAMQGGFRVIIPRECVGDRSPAQGEANLIDMDAKNGDVLPVADVIAKLASY